MMPVRHVMVIDQNPFFTDGICGLLECDPNTVIHAGRNLAEVDAQFQDVHSDLAVLGPNLPEHEAFAACRQIARASPAAPVIVLSRDAHDLLFQIDAVHAGAAAVLPADVGPTDFRAAVAAIEAGHTLISREVLTRALTPIALSPRELEVAKLLSEGKTDKEIARQLVVSHATIRNHVQRILEKLGAHSRQEAARRARRRGAVP